MGKTGRIYENTKGRRRGKATNPSETETVIISFVWAFE